MSRIAKLGFPLALCLVTATLFTCGKDSPTRPSRPKAVAPPVSTVPTTPHSVSIEPDSSNSVYVGQSLRLRAVVKDRNGTVMAGEIVTWSSSVETAATVSEGGVVSALSAGSTQINAVTGSLSASRSVTVRNPVVASADTATTEDPLSQDTTTVSILESNKDSLGTVQDTAALVTQQVDEAPDLIVESPAVSANILSVGERFELSATVRNQGNAGGGFLMTLTYYSSTDATITTADTDVGSDLVTSLDPSETSDESIRLVAPLVAGTYYYGACIEILTEESDKQNNCSEGVAMTVIGPDLIVESLAVSDTMLSAGQRFSLTATVLNQGAGDTRGFTTVRFYSSTDTTISTSDTEIGDWFISGLDTSESQERSLNFLMAPATGGTYYYGACVDPLPEETDKQNNCSVALAVTVGGTDLIVQSLTISNDSLSVGERFSLTATVHNRGTGDAQAFTNVRFYSSTDATISTGDTEIGSWFISTLDADESQERTLNFLNAPSAAGTYYYGACVDSLAGEADTQNNCSDALTVTVGGPDLIVESPIVSDNSPNAGQRLSLRATVRNQGAGDALEWTTIRFYQSDDTAISTSDTEIGTWTISPLDASETQERSLSFLYAPTIGGTYHYGACVDPLSAEADTQNNCSIGVTVTISGPDLIVLSPTVSESNPEAGERFDFNATIQNQGEGDATSSATLRYYRSTDAVISSGDTEVGTDFVNQLDANETAEESISLNAPSTAGTFYYGACADALSNETDAQNNCSVGVAVTVGQTANRPPVAQGGIPIQDVDAGETVSVDMSSYFTDPDGNLLTYRAFTSNASVATAFIPDHVVTIRGESAGNATITITASDGSLTAGQSIRVTVRGAVVVTPDLVVELPSVSDGSLDAGESFTLSATVRNRGTGDATTFSTLRYYRSADATITTADVETGSESVTSLDVSQSSDHSIDLTAPSTPGTYYYGACIDALSDEVDTQNNCSIAVTVTVIEPGNRAPVAQGIIPEQDVDAGNSITMDMSSFFSDPDNDQLSYTASSSNEAVATASIPSDELTISGESAGNATITVTASDGSLTARQTIRVAVRQLHVPKPDLVVESPSVSDSSPDAGEPFTFNASVRNRGDGDATFSTTLRVYQSTDATVPTGDVEVAAESVAALDASESSGKSIGLAAPSDPGVYYYGACVDEVSNESDGQNNCSVAVALTIGQPANRAPVAQGTVPDQNVNTGATVSLDMTSYFSDPDNDQLTYSASTSNAAVATASIPNDRVTITGISVGNATITVTASDGSLTAGQTIRVTVQQLVVPKPDLIVDSPTVSDGSPDPGDRITLNATVRNRGDGDATSSTTLRYYLSTDATISSNDTALGTDHVFSLDSSETSDEFIRLDAPLNAGTYYYGACVDALPDESDTQNNCSVAVTVTVVEPVNRAPVAQGSIPAQTLDVDESIRVNVSSYFQDPDGDGLTFSASTSDAAVSTVTTAGNVATLEGQSAGNATITVTASDGSLTARQTIQVTVQIPVVLAPDLIVESPTVSKNNLSSEERFTLRATVRNQGNGRGSSTTLRYYLSTDATITSADMEVGTDRVFSLRASSTGDEFISLRAPSALGTHFYGACVDPLSEESDAQNNCSVSVMVTVSGPDLVVGPPTVSNAVPEVEEPFTLSVTVRNQGAGDANSTTLRYFQSTDATISTGDTEVGTDYVFSLDASESGDESITLTASDAAGTYYFGACVDAESDETDIQNNCSSAVAIEVREKPTIVGASSYVYLTQAVQSVGDPVPLIDGDETLLRVFIAREGNMDISIPPVRATFYQNGAVTHTADIPGQDTRIPDQIDESELELSANALIPGSVIEPGLEMVVEIDPDGTLDPMLEIGQRLPPTGRMSVDVSTVTSFDIMIIPFLWEDNPDRSIITQINAVTADGALLRETRDYLPVGDISVSVHDPVFVSYDPTGDKGEDLVSLTKSIHAMEGSPDTYYMGVFRRQGDNGLLGIAYVGGYFFGQNREFASVSVLQGPVIAHEFGHNLSLRHAPCGGPARPDPNFPDRDGSIGAWGYDFLNQELISPSRPDLMSYCDPEWIGYFNFNKSLRWRQSKDVRLAAEVSTRGLLLWGRVTEESDLVLEPAFVVNAPPVLPHSSGPYRLSGQSVEGAELFDLSFDMTEFGDSEGGGFNFILPVQADWQARLDQITLTGPEGVVTQDSEGDRTAALLLDTFTGQVRGLLHDWLVPRAGGPPARRVPPEPGLEIVTSKGVPDANDW